MFHRRYGISIPVIASALLAVALLSGSGSCDPNRQGNVEASTVGALSDVAAVRGAFDAELHAACGTPDFARMHDTQLSRLPYLQDVRADAASLLWTTRDGGGDYAVTVTDSTTREERSFSTTRDDDAPESAHQHIARVTGLQPARIYCYSLQQDGETITPDFGFRTAPERLAGTDDEPRGESQAVEFSVFGDSGYGGDNQHAVLQQLQSVKSDLVLVTGDVAYDSGSLAQFEHTFFGVYKEMLPSVPFYPVLGNHDYNTDDGAPFRQVFALPDNSGPQGRDRYYSFDWGPVHFVAVDTEQIGPTQEEWFKDLAQSDAPWKIVFLHRSPYASGPHGSSKDVRAAFSPIFEAHGVQLVLAGHDHDYERSKPMNGVTYVVTGGGGRGTRPVTMSTFTAFSQEVLHFVHVKVAGDTLRLYAIDATGQEFDFARLDRDAERDAEPTAER